MLWRSILNQKLNILNNLNEFLDQSVEVFGVISGKWRPKIDSRLDFQAFREHSGSKCSGSVQILADSQNPGKAILFIYLFLEILFFVAQLWWEFRAAELWGCEGKLWADHENRREDGRQTLTWCKGTWLLAAIDGPDVTQHRLHDWRLTSDYCVAVLRLHPIENMAIQIPAFSFHPLSPPPLICCEPSL